jgi:hypothetical protein
MPPAVCGVQRILPIFEFGNQNFDALDRLGVPNLAGEILKI